MTCVRGIMKIYFDDHFQRDNFKKKYQQKGLKILSDHNPDTNLLVFECPKETLTEITKREIVGNVELLCDTKIDVYI